MPIRVAINGFGRIGRPVFRVIFKEHPDLEIVAINDLADPKTLAHLLEHDSVYGRYQKQVRFSDNTLLIDGMSEGRKVMIFAENDPAKLPWRNLKIDVVLECTGRFTSREGAQKHLEAGAKKVIISAPSETKEVPTFVLGVNEEKYNQQKDSIISMASCTTNCLAPIVRVLEDNFKIVRGFMSTIHSYTNDQRILDLAHKDLRRARAAAVNIIPTSTGAAAAIGKVIPELEGKLDGIAFRVPVATVSVVDLVCIVEKETTKEEVNYVLKKASGKDKLEGILGVEDIPLVSSDYIGNPFSAVVDSLLTMVKGKLIKITAWYDNEWAYACRLAEFAEYVGKKL